MDTQKALEIIIMLLNRAPINIAEQVAAKAAIDKLRSVAEADEKAT